MYKFDVDLTGSKVLMVDDTPENLNVLRSILQAEGYRLFAAANGETAIKLAAKTKPQLILMDVMMPDITGFEACRRIKEIPELADIPIIFVTALGAIEDMVKGFQCGAVDYIGKPIRQEELLARVRTHLKIMALLENHKQQTAQLEEKNKALKEAYIELEEISVTDPVTGMKNRRFLPDPLDADIVHTLRLYRNWLEDDLKPRPTEADLIFFMMDIDHFKVINDTYGHVNGDRLLRRMRALIEKVFRKSDYMVRWGGEEFLVVARFVDRSQGSMLAERLRSIIEECEFGLGSGETTRCTCSIGYASYPFEVNQPTALSWGQVVGVADCALYAAKKSARNAWVGIEHTGDTISDDFYQQLQLNPQELTRQGIIKLTHSLSEHQPLNWK